MRPTVTRVYPGDDGKLVYVPDEQGNTIHDASHAGYGGGGVVIPTAAVRETIWPVAGDNTANLQAAIDKVSALPLDKSGFRGAVLLRAGYYKMAAPVHIQASGVVLRGEGMGDTGTILVGTVTPREATPPAAAAAAAAANLNARPQAPAQGAPEGGRGGRGGPGGPGGPGGRGPGGRGGGGGRANTLVMIGGASGAAPKEETKTTVTDDYTPVGSRTLKVASARGFRPGDTVIVRRIGNQDWVDTMGMNGKEYPQDRWPAPFNTEWDRVVTEVQGNSITVDAPITCAIEKKWGGGEVVKYEDPERIEHVGVENLRGLSEFDPTVRTKEYGNMDRPNYAPEEYYSDENHWQNLITLANTKNGWVRNVTAMHFVNSLAGTNAGAKWITIQD
ncbi:MAG TPA: hypothetical protein VMU19_04905, partial [Bryobacteraceae bacterium]|nr:hypothetical protein [Bryobacteraceae bacterium]